MTFQGKVVIVTGATGGMGSAIAKALVQEGASVILNGRDEEKGNQLERALDKQAYFVGGDVSDPDTNKQLVQTAVSRFGRLDLVVTNAGTLGLGSVTDLNLRQWKETIDINLSSVYYLCHYAIPEMKKQDKGVVVINSSIAAFKSFPNHAAYCAGKAGLVALAKQMAADYGPSIRVNAICPGPVDTPLIWDSAKAFVNPEEIVQKTAKNTLMKRLGTPEDVASLVLFLLSDKASWITGSAFTIDGGILAR